MPGSGTSAMDNRCTGPFRSWRFRYRGVRFEAAFLGGLAALLGAGTALLAYVFHVCIENGVTGRGFTIVLRLATGAQWTVPLGSDGIWAYLLVLGIPALGLCLAAGLMRLLAGDAPGHGVAGIMEAMALRGGRLRVRPALARVLASILTIASGGSVGPEDPNVQIGATVGSWLGQRLHLSTERVQTLVACGAASGIAAAFNAPVAGVFFAQEIILGEFTVGGLSMVVISTVSASVISRILRGESPAFLIPEYSLRSPWEVFLYLALGLLAALASVFYVRILLAIEEMLSRWKSPFLLRAALGGLAVGAVGLAFPQLFGVGYETMDALLRGEEVATGVLLALLLLKPLLTATTLGSGGSGGVFAPSLFIGSMLGGAFGQVVQRLFPQVTAPAPAYALVGMGAVLAGAVHCPITAIFLLFEMTRDYHIILPIMLCAVVSTLVSRRLAPGSVYTGRLAQRGIYLHLGRDLNVMEMVTVEEAMSRDFDTARPEMTLEELGRLFEQSAHHGFPVVDREGRLRGIVTLTDYHRALEEGKGRTVADICTADPLTLFPDQSLHEAMCLFSARDVGRIPVVSREDPRRIVGLLRRYDLIRAYNKGLARRAEMERRMQEMRLASHRGGELLTLELPAGAAAIGYAVRDLHLPLGTIIVAIQRGGRALIPRGNTSLQAGDSLILMVDRPETAGQVRALLLEGRGLPRGEEVRHGEYILPAASPAVGRRIAELGLPEGCLVLEVQRGDRLLIPHGDTVLQAGDRLLVAAAAEELPAVERFLLPQGRNPEAAG
ncbi:MAG: chloride channel protein [Chloroflexia bacterium]